MNNKIKSSIYIHYRKSKNLFHEDNLSYFSNKNIILVNFHDFTYNWGDYINRFLIENITGKKVVSAKRVYNWKGKEILFGVGSILQSNLSNSVIWGSGFVKPVDKIKKKPKKVLALRGEFTGEIFRKNGIEFNEVYGDPALLFPGIYSSRKEKNFKLGIIPHYTEMPFFVKNEKFFRSQDILIINPLISGKNPFSFIDEILKCENILSSSLHGLILADTYSIPSSRFIFRENEIKGGDFKYNDYYSGVGIKNFPTVRLKSLSLQNFIGLEREAEKKKLVFSSEKLRNSLLRYSDSV